MYKITQVFLKYIMYMRLPTVTFWFESKNQKFRTQKSIFMLQAEVGSNKLHLLLYIYLSDFFEKKCTSK